ncbi:hypothetical protein LshimejAT787_1005190 [Lyophyllum shimeji]|uniref:HAT C-terminal dimerisation domain-containing protein n=1 Tax=Lyophyllum shimeji TaxID=47721 RepID=A0A9P3UNR9_LYOSH|nr:hypothetical protein LshimejAT787_1005190 [Lyophyllum shimeji]
MMTTSNRTLHTVRVFDTSADRKTAVELIAKMKEVKELVESSEWNVTVIAVTGDAAGESRRARLDLGVLFPELLLPDCYGHQINLIVGDYFGVPYTLLLLDKADDATELITWLRSKTYVLAQVRVIQEVNHFQVLSVIQAVISRWTAHYLAFKRLLELRLPLEMMVRQDRLKDVSQICTGKRKAREKAERMFEVIEDPVFWHSVLRLKRHLEPLALAANITQLTHVRPDQVLVVFGLLYAEYQLVKDQDTDIETKILVDAIQASIEKRWAKTDQEVFIVALILNPLYKTKPFTYLDITTAAGLLELVKKLYRRFFGTLSADESHELFQELGDYLNGMGIYRNLENYAQDLVRQARELGEHLDPVKAWDGVRHLSRPRTPLQKLAHRIHSITTNSASCERLFSAFGTTLTRLRSRLRSKSMVDLAELRVHLRNEHVREGRVKARLKRKMTTHDDTTTDGADPATTNQVEPQLAIANADDDSPDEDIDQERAASASESGSLRSVATRHSHTEADEPSPQETINSRRIADIFDFTTDTWRQLAKEFALRGLNEEQEFYELVDLDAGGEDEETEELLNEVTQSALRV